MPAATPARLGELRTIPVALPSNPYPICLGAGSLGRLGALLLEQGFKAGTRALVVSNPVVAEHYGPPTLAALREAGFDAEMLVLEAEIGRAHV